MNIKLLTANDITKMKLYFSKIIKTNPLVYCDHTIEQIVLKDAASTRNLIFEGRLICFAEMNDSGEIMKLLIVNNSINSEENNYFLNILTVYLDQEFINQSCKYFLDIYNFQKLKKLKLCLKTEDVNSNIVLNLKKIFKLEIDLPVNNHRYLEMSYCI